jgi:hypothetical protein
MTAHKKTNPEEIERQLRADADNPDAWESVATVGTSQAPRPSWYRAKTLRPRKSTTSEPTVSKK